MKISLPIADCQLPIAGRAKRLSSAIVNRKSQIENGFTMMEIAISLAVIGIALVAIIGILPLGLRTQKENRERTLINQDASVFMEAIRNGASVNASDTDLTNYVFAITNYWYLSTEQSPRVDGYTYFGSDIKRPFSAGLNFPLTNNYCILGLMSTPEFTDANGKPLPTWMPNLPGGCYSNHIVVYVHSMSGLALEKPPQGNALLVQNSFGYHILCQNLPSAFPFPTNWNSSVNYNQGDQVYVIAANGAVVFCQSLTNNNQGNNPLPLSTNQWWGRDGYTQTMANSAREFRLTFQWPTLPNGKLGAGRQTYRTLIAGQLVETNIPTKRAVNLYFFEPQIFTNTP